MDSTKCKFHCGFRLQFADSTYILRNPLTICGFHLQFADSAYSCGFHKTSIQLHTCLIICWWIPQNVLDSANTLADSANSLTFGAILSGTLFQVTVFGIQKSKEDKKVAMLRIPQQI